MERIVHYTSNQNWGMIKELGFLLPKSNPNTSPGTLSDRVSSLISEESYLVGIPNPLDAGWVKSGLMEYILERTTGEVLLNVPILNKNGAFVRDHIHASPKRFRSQYGEDLWGKLLRGEIEFNDPRIVEAANSYLESTTSLESYNGNYEVPEIWLPQKTPISQITKI